MSSPQVETELAAALDIEDWEDSINRVKYIVSRSIVSVDDSVRIVPTQYFNHSNVPDLVLEWPSRGSKNRRNVYLRPTQDPRQIAVDVKNHAADRPIFIHLSNLDRDHVPVPLRSNVESLSEAAKQTQSLVTELNAVTTLSSTSSSPTAKLLPSSVLRGGRGLIEAGTAAIAAATVGVGFDGAMEANGTATAKAIETISSVLAPAEATELTSFLEAVWVASGGGAMDFPGPIHDLGSKLPPARLKLFLELIASESVEFWTRVGESVDLDSFADLNLVGEQPSLQTLLNAALPKLQARTCRIMQTERADQESDPFLWQVESGILSLRGYGRQAWVANKKEQLPHAIDTEARPSPTSFSLRAKDADISITTVELSGGGRSLVYRAEAEGNIADDEIIGTLDEALGAGSKVNQATAALHADKLLTVDYRNGTASGHSSTRFKVPALLEASWRLLNSIEPDEEIALSEILGTNQDSGLTGGETKTMEAGPRSTKDIQPGDHL